MVSCKRTALTSQEKRKFTIGQKQIIQQKCVQSQPQNLYGNI